MALILHYFVEFGIILWAHCKRQRFAFKVAGLVHQSLAGTAPEYLADDCHLLSDAGRRPLRSHSSDIRKAEAARATNT